MHIFLWCLQIFLALHTAMGAMWKLANPEQTVPALNAIPHPAWLALSVFEVFCSVGLVAAAWRVKPLTRLPPVAACGIAAEMLLFCGLFVYSGDTEYAALVYWLVVAAVSVFIAYGRFVLKPLT